MTQINELEEFNKILESNPDTLIVIDFSASWCGPCKRISPEVEKLEEKFNNKIKVFKVDVDDSIDISEKMKIISLFKRFGRVFNRW